MQACYLFNNTGRHEYKYQDNQLKEIKVVASLERGKWSEVRGQLIFIINLVELCKKKENYKVKRKNIRQHFYAHTARAGECFQCKQKSTAIKYKYENLFHQNYGFIFSE